MSTTHLPSRVRAFTWAISADEKEDLLIRRPGMAALRALQDLTPPSHRVNAFVAAESQLAAGGRRHLVGEWGVPKDRVTFCGYWRCPTSR